MGFHFILTVILIYPDGTAKISLDGSLGVSDGVSKISCMQLAFKQLLLKGWKEGRTIRSLDETSGEEHNFKILPPGIIR